MLSLVHISDAALEFIFSEFQLDLSNIDFRLQQKHISPFLEHLVPNSSVDSSEYHNVQSLLPSETDRSIPAWELSWFILDRLICGLCCFYNTRPNCLAIFEKSGIAYHIDRHNRIVEKPHPDVKERVLLGCFSIHDNQHTQRTNDFKAKEYIETQLKRESMQGARLAQVKVDAPGQGQDWINARWWQARGFEISTNGTEFGCACHH